MDSRSSYILHRIDNIKNINTAHNSVINNISNDVINYYTNDSVEKRFIAENGGMNTTDKIPKYPPLLLRQFNVGKNYNRNYIDKLEALSNINIEYIKSLVSATTFLLDDIKYIIDNMKHRLILNTTISDKKDTWVNLYVNINSNILKLHFDGIFYVKMYNSRMNLSDGENINVMSSSVFLDLETD